MLNKKFTTRLFNFACFALNQTTTKMFIASFVVFAALTFTVNSARAITVTVTKIADTGDEVCDADCSLREALSRLRNSTTNDVINFAPDVFSTPQTIKLSGVLRVFSRTGTLTINGTGAKLLTIDANNTGRVFFFDPGTNVIINDVTITGGNMRNTALVGGAIANAGGVLTLNNSVLRNNQGDNGAGGGAISSGSFNASGPVGFLTVNNCVFEGNSAGGGSAILLGGPGTITNSTFNNNIGNSTINSTLNSAPSSVTISNSTFYFNSAGGVIVSDGVSSTTTMNLTNVTVANNFGIGFSGRATARNSIFANNSASDFSGTLNSQGYNLIKNTTGTTILGTTTGNILNQDPLLAEPANNGGQTFTMALLPGSPAIDAGDPANFPPTDQRGLIRPADGDGNGSRLPDIGAYERNALPIYRAPFDFDGDGASNLSVFRPSSGIWYTSTNPAINYGAVQFGAPNDELVPADYDGDGRADIAVFRPSNGTWYIQRSRLGFFVIQFGANGDFPVPADYNGDGQAELAVFRPSTGTWYTSTEPALNYGAVLFGAAGDKPVPADYDGDGKADIAVFRPSSGVWYRLNSSNNQFTGVQFGASGDVTVPADYDGDRRADVAVFRPSNGGWYLLRSNLGYIGLGFGFGTDLPVPADYDGDSVADIAVFRPSNGVWYLNRTTQGFVGIAFGIATDKPIPNAYVR